jgi:hypothetical protein
MEQLKQTNGMSELQWSAFRVWYASPINTGKTKRSLVYTAEKLQLERRLVHDWYRVFNWKGLAARKDAELDLKLEKAFVEKIVATFEEALDRQRMVIQRIIERFLQQLPDLRISVAEVKQLLEYETNFAYDQQRGLPQGNNLGVVLHMMTPEQRTEFNAIVERGRDAGQLRLDADRGVGHPGRN